MPQYLLHYCYDHVVGSTTLTAKTLNNPPRPEPRQGRLHYAAPYELQYASDVAEAEEWIAGTLLQQGVVGKNFQLLNWQRLEGDQRPVEAL